MQESSDELVRHGEYGRALESSWARLRLVIN